MEILMVNTVVYMGGLMFPPFGVPKFLPEPCSILAAFQQHFGGIRHHLGGIWQYLGSMRQHLAALVRHFSNAWQHLGSI
jgi:hypothetical protein